MPIRDYFSENFGWKVLSAVLAVLIWFAVNFGIHPESGAGAAGAFSKASRDFDHLPITVMSTAADTRSFKVTPAEVSLKVTGDQNLLDALRPGDIEVYVNLVGVKEGRVMRKRIQVYTPAGVTSSRIQPEDVIVERVEPVQRVPPMP